MQLYIVRHRIGYLLEPGMNLPIVQLASDPRFEWAQRRTKLDGKLVLSFDISEDGQTKSLLIVSPMGMGVDDEAARTVSSWRFKPARCSDRPCAVHARVAFDFTPLFSNRPLN
jgi:TonB family protein